MDEGRGCWICATFGESGRYDGLWSACAACATRRMGLSPDLCKKKRGMHRHCDVNSGMSSGAANDANEKIARKQQGYTCISKTSAEVIRKKQLM